MSYLLLSICSAWLLVFISLGDMMRVTVPSGEIMNVVRNVHMYLRPYMDFSPYTPNSFTSLWSVSAISGNGKEFFAMNFLWESSLSTLTPITWYPASISA